MAGVQQGTALAVVFIHAVKSGREEAGLNHFLDHLASADERFVVEGAAGAVSRVLKGFRPTDPVYQVHEEHGAGPAVEVGQGEGIDVVGFEHFSYFIKLFHGGGDLQAEALKDVCAVEDRRTDDVVQRNAVDAAVKLNRPKADIHEIVDQACLVQGFGHIPDLASSYVLQKRAAAPAQEDVRFVACAHGDHELGLVLIVDDGHAFDLDARIGRLKTRNGIIQRRPGLVVGYIDVPSLKRLGKCRRGKRQAQSHNDGKYAEFLH